MARPPLILTHPALAFLLGVVALAFTVEAAMGFGATVVTVALASMVISLEVVLPAFVPLNVVMSTYLVVRHARSISRALLLREVLPAMVVGMPAGMVLFRFLSEEMLRLTLGVFVVVVSALELRAGSRARGPLRRPVSFGLLALGGVVHGAFATGGPLVVYVLGRKLADDKAAFRATLSALWLALNLVLCASYAQAGRITAESMMLTAQLGVMLVLGLVVGERVHRAVSPARFRRMVFALLFVVGIVLVVRVVMPHVR